MTRVMHNIYKILVDKIKLNEIEKISIYNRRNL